MKTALLVRRRRSGGFNPATLFAGDIDGFYYDFTDETTVFSDAAGTTPTTPGSALGAVEDLSPNDIDSSQSNVALQGKWGKAPKDVRNLLINTATLATQNRTVTAVEHTLSFKGTGTVTLSGTSTAGPLVGTGADDRVSLVFTPTAGTLTLTVSGTVTEGMLEIGSLSNYQEVGASDLDVTEVGVPSYGFYRPDLSDDVLPATIPDIDGDYIILGRNGTWIEPAAPSAGTFNVGPTTYTGGTPGILRAVGDVVNDGLINKTLSDAERERLIRYYQGRGAKGLLVPGPELVTNGGFDTDTDWTKGTGWTIAAGVATFSNPTGTSLTQSYSAVPNNSIVLLTFDMVHRAGNGIVPGVNGDGGIDNFGSVADFASTKTHSAFVVTSKQRTGLSLTGVGTSDFDIDNVSLRELRPEEDW